MNFEIETEDGNIECDVISFFENDDKKYVIYTDKTLDEDGYENMYGSRYQNVDGKIELVEIETDEEWDMLDKELRRIKDGKND